MAYRSRPETEDDRRARRDDALDAARSALGGGRWEAAVHRFEEALALLATSKSADLELEATLGLASAHAGAGTYDAGVDVAARVLPMLERNTGVRRTVAARVALAEIHDRCGRAASALEQLRAACDGSASSSPVVQRSALRPYLAMLCLVRPRDGGWEYTSRYHDLCELEPASYRRADAQLVLGDLHRGAGRRDEAHASYERGLALVADDRRGAGIRAMLASRLASTTSDRENAQSLVATADTALASVPAAETAAVEGVVRFDDGEVRAAAGDHLGAVARHRTALEARIRAHGERSMRALESRVRLAALEGTKLELLAQTRADLGARHPWIRSTVPSASPR